MVLYGVVPECHGRASGMVSECIMSAKMVSLNASGRVLVSLISYAASVKQKHMLFEYLNKLGTGQLVH